MMTIIIVLHMLICVGLIGIVLIQRGRGSGLVESFAGVESMFGTKTNAFLTRATSVLSALFFLTCLSLAFLSAKQSKSILSAVNAETKAPVNTSANAPIQQGTQAAPKTQEKAADVQTQAPLKDEKSPQAPKTE